MKLPDQIRLVALDMDGTLLNTQHRITAYTRATLQRASESGLITAIATGRALSELAPLMEEIKGIQYLIHENGACIRNFQTGLCIARLSIPFKEVMYILEHATKYDAVIQMFIDDQSWFVAPCDMDFPGFHLQHFKSVLLNGSRFDPNLLDQMPLPSQNVDKINLFFRNDDTRCIFRKVLADRPFEVVDSIGIGLEIACLGATKGNALSKLCQVLGIPTLQTAAVGDGPNDVDLLESAGYAIAMGNACQKVLALADDVTLNNDEDGAARAIEKLLRN